MISLIVCVGALLGLVCVSACCTNFTSRHTYEYHQYLERNKKAPPSHPFNDWTRFL